jgi:Na+/melibiose symporter-like transporter
MNFFGKTQSAGFGLFNAGGIVMMIIGITFSKNWQINLEKGMRLSLHYLFLHFIIVLYILSSESSRNYVPVADFTRILYGISTPLWAMIADVADYSEWKNNRRATAIIFLP